MCSYQHHLLPEMLLWSKPKSSNSVRSNSPTVSYRSEAAIFCRLLLCLGCFYGYLGLCFLPLWPTHSGALYGTIVAMWDLQATKFVNCKKETNAKWSYDGAYPRSKAILYHSFGSVTTVILQWMQLKVIQNLTRSVGPLEDALVALPVRRQAKSDPRESHLNNLT